MDERERQTWTTGIMLMLMVLLAAAIAALLLGDSHTLLDWSRYIDNATPQ